MEYPQYSAAVLVLTLLLTGIHASILYPTDGDKVVKDTLINPKDVFLNSPPSPILGVEYMQGFVDKKGGIYTSIPQSPQVYLDLWYNCELHFVQHPTGQLLYSENSPLKSRGTDDVRAAFGYASFEATSVFVLTYANYTADGTADPPMNTFQMVLITDGSATFAEFNYPPEQMGWWHDSSGIYPTMRIRYEGETIMIIPRSGTPGIQDTIMKGNTPNLPGRWMFRIDGTCPTCVETKGGYMLSCVDGNATKCVCSSCMAESLDSGGLTEEEINILISALVIAGLAVIAVGTGVGLYYKKHKK